MLDKLQDRGFLEWRWDYDNDNSRAIYWVAQPSGEDKRQLDIRRVEQLVGNLCEQHGIVWLPVPNPGGEPQLRETLRRT